MKIALCSDEPYPVNFFLAEYLKGLGHEVLRFGSLKTQKPESWVEHTREASQAIVQGQCDEGIFFCWTGTGVSILANKIPGIRAALCTDAETAKGARLWNDANVLVMSNRLVSNDVAKEITLAWLGTSYQGMAEEALEEMRRLETRNR